MFVYSDTICLLLSIKLIMNETEMVNTVSTPNFEFFQYNLHAESHTKTVRSEPLL